MIRSQALARAVLHTRGPRRGSARTGVSGFTLPELIVVVAIVGLSVAVAIPLVSHELRMARIRATADRFASDLRAARMIAVSTRKAVPVHVSIAPDNFYSYTDARGDERQVTMEEGVDIVSTTVVGFLFKTDGSIAKIDGSALRDEVVTVLRSTTSGDQWTVTTSLLGIPRTRHDQID